MTSMKTALGVIGVMMLAFATGAVAADLPDISLPAPRMEGGKPLMQALKERQTLRSFSEKKLPPQVLSDLLWAAAGINRPDSGKRTVPSARNLQIVEVYAVMESGAYLYDAKANCLKAVAKGDLRKLTGRQDFVSSAPLNLVFVADYAKMKRTSPEDQMLYSASETGFISQNVYLFCASEGLSTVVRAMVDRKALAKALNLPEQKKIILAQTVGYPKIDGR
ncbi:MAG: SagB/ThcOx family dehydrogenase [Candidatus Sumerlaeota bacterium]|nr:SagB/ThcOx family dehydrogenase [Candidatus Sumerlaeota bacterium]